MIRLLGFLVLFAVGLAAAVFWQGQMHHLRRAVPDDLPGWTQALPGDAGMRVGQMALPAQGRVPAMALHWAAKAPGADGLLWDLRLSGQGVDLRAELLLPWWPDRVVLRGGGGAVDLAVVSDGAVTGLVALQSIAAEMTDLANARVISGTVVAQAKAISVEGEALGSGPVSGQLQADGAWLAEIALTGGLSPVVGQIDGTLTGRFATLDVTVADPAALPAQARDAIQAVGKPVSGGLQVVLPIPLRN